MLALVDSVPHTLSIDSFLRLWVKHQIEVIVRRTQFRLRKAEERAHILRGYLKALDALDEVIALIRRSPSSDEARTGLMELLEVDEIQANAILDLQLRRLAALERLKIQEEAEKIEQLIAEYNHILETPSRQREIVSEELDEIVERYGDDRRTKILAGFDGDVSIRPHPRRGSRRHDHPWRLCEADPVEPVPRAAPRRQGHQGAALRGDDVVEQFFVTSTHNWLLFFTNTGRVYRARPTSCPRVHVMPRVSMANLLALQPASRSRRCFRSATTKS